MGRGRPDRRPHQAAHLPDRDFLLEDFDGDPHGVADSSEAFAKAIAAAHATGPVRIADLVTGLDRPPFTSMPTRADPVPMPPRRSRA